MFSYYLNRLISAISLQKLDMLFLRLGLALTLLYAGFSIFIAPTNWVGFVPSWVHNIYPAESFIILHGVLDVLLGVGLLSGRLLWLFSAVSFFNLAGILFFYGVDDITFRDLGLSMAALALFVRSMTYESKSSYVA